MNAILAGLTLMTASASGAVTFSDIADVGFYSAGDFLTKPIDFNGDGVDDMIFRNFGDEFAAFSTSTIIIAKIAARPSSSWRYSSREIRLSAITSAMGLSLWRGPRPRKLPEVNTSPA